MNAGARRRVLAVPDTFRGSATAQEVAAAIAAGAEAADWDATQLPLADGGEGTLEVFGEANRESAVTGPHGRPVRAAWLLRPDGVAVVETARAAGLLLAGGAIGNDPVAATTRGAGELVAQAIEAGASRVVVTLGGSATTDGGLGAVDVLERYRPLGGPGAQVEVLVACDVTTRFEDAARVFGPQKGATPEQVAQLGDRLRLLVEQYRDRFGVDVSTIPGGGAAGGLGGGLAALGARLVPGFALVAEHVDLEAAMVRADVVVTGEGALDVGSFDGKVVGGVVQVARRHNRPVLVVAGRVDAAVRGRVLAEDLTERFGAEASWSRTAACVTEVVSRYLIGLDAASA